MVQQMLGHASGTRTLNSHGQAWVCLSDSRCIWSWLTRRAFTLMNWTGSTPRQTTSSDADVDDALQMAVPSQPFVLSTPFSFLGPHRRGLALSWQSIALASHS